MQLGLALLLTAGAVGVFQPAFACSEEHDHVHEHQKRLYPQVSLTPPSNPLVWSDLANSHGWLLGHQHTSFPEPNYSGDLGDFASFVSHMKQIALDKDVDLLLVDSGDLHDGTGLSDGYPSGGVDGQQRPILLEFAYDLMTIGNHELYDYGDAYDVHTNFDNNAVSVPVGNQYAKFTTRKGRSVTSLGILYDFTGNAKNTTVQTVAKMVAEKWFKDAIADEPDVFLLIGYVPVCYRPTVFKAIRKVHADTPILIFGGHTHIRNCARRAVNGLESGRYMETVGADLNGSADSNITFTRRYLDPNRVTYEYHTQTSNTTFDTPEGQNITAGLQKLAADFDLSYLYGTAPQDYTLSRSTYPSNSSILTLFVSEAMPYSLTLNNSRASYPNIMIVNSEELRFDLYSGAFTKNDQLTSSPFLDQFLYLPNVSFSVASQVLSKLNNQNSDRRSSEQMEREPSSWLEEMDRNAGGPERRAASNLTLGYVTSDSCPGVGDDTPHNPLPYYSSPDYIASNAPDVSDDTPTDLVFVTFIQSDVLEVVNNLQSTKTYTAADVETYSPVLANAVLGLYAQKYWN
ncbi:5'-nucleotidase [Amylocystis lapponica]|nr:5'-nucleotidase [Amylocystis lapponica]